MPRLSEHKHSILIVSSSEKFTYEIKKSVVGFITIDVSRSVALARRCILEKQYNIVVIDVPLSDETGEDFAIDITEKCNSSVIIVAPNNMYGNTVERVNNHGVLVIPRPYPKGRMDMAIRYLTAIQDKMSVLDSRYRNARHKLEEIKIISKAKILLVQKKNMTEDEAHKYIGKSAMDLGMSRVKVALEIIDEME